jgi:hypothetical protein
MPHLKITERLAVEAPTASRYDSWRAEFDIHSSGRQAGMEVSDVAFSQSCTCLIDDSNHSIKFDYDVRTIGRF